MSAILLLSTFPLGQHRLQSRDILANRAQPQRILQLFGRAAKPQAETLFLELRDARLDLVGGQLANLFCPHSFAPCVSAFTRSSRTTNLVLSGIFAAASAIAFCASGFAMPSSSNITRPGFTTATHPSGEPLPLPMRVSAGFLVIGLSGKILIQTFPPRLMCRVSATRAASICRFETQPGSSACRP